MREPAENLLITGGTGLLGLRWAQLCKSLCAVTAATHVRSVRLAGVAFQKVDLGLALDLDRIIVANNARIVVHTAGLTSVERCEADPERARHENTDIAAEVARAAFRNGCRLIHISTDHLFSGTEDLYDEDAPVSPVNVYGRTKADAETAVLAACPKALVVRTNFYGWGPPYRASFSDWILNRLAVGDSVPLFEDVHYTPTLMAPMIEAAMELSARGVHGIVHLTGDNAITKFEFGRRLAAQFGYGHAKLVPTRLVDEAGLVRRPLSMALSTKRLRSLLGRGLGPVDEHLQLLAGEAAMPAVREIRSL